MNSFFSIVLALAIMCSGYSNPGVNTEGTPIPSVMSGLAEDDTLKVSIHATKEKNSLLYKTKITFTNKTNTGIDLIFDCGSLISSASISKGDICPAVYSMLLKKSSTEEKVGMYDKNFFEGRTLSVTYEQEEGVRKVLEIKLKAKK
ncbi:hypothetical protein [Paenibacillus sp. 481]|uniref:hypothetical protein n=1 Tax=Paenibacillus sp. 481 TaxID=2835869 RepID=UPI001E43EBF9|nr:hypothetical protein [Paenibacillus sp. 481]UHA73638.1 hypothetical protein KIK04_00170 [Paenibacillus sp. 481]